MAGGADSTSSAGGGSGGGAPPGSAPSGGADAVSALSTTGSTSGSADAIGTNNTDAITEVANNAAQRNITGTYIDGEPGRPEVRRIGAMSGECHQSELGVGRQQRMMGQDAHRVADGTSNGQRRRRREDLVAAVGGFGVRHGHGHRI